MAYADKQKIKPTNINYTSKDFSTIKADLIEYTKSYFPDTYKDFNETSPFMILIYLSSYVGDVLSYYIDENQNVFELRCYGILLHSYHCRYKQSSSIYRQQQHHKDFHTSL